MTEIAGTVYAGPISGPPANPTFRPLATSDLPPVNGIVSVKAFGAVGDGSNDETAAFQAALDWMRVNGGEIFVPAGKYRITDQLDYVVDQAWHGPRIRGVGTTAGNEGGASVLFYAFANGRSLFKVRSTLGYNFLDGGYIEDIHIVSPYSAGCTATAGGTTVTNVNAFYFHVGQRVRMLNGNTPVTFGGAAETTIAAIDLGLQTVTLAKAPDASVPGATGLLLYGFFSQQAALDLGNMLGFGIRRVRFDRICGHGIWTPQQYATDSLPPNDKPWVYVDRARPTGRIAQVLARVNPTSGAITSFVINRPGTGYRPGATIHVTGCGKNFVGTAVVDSVVGVISDPTATTQAAATSYPASILSGDKFLVATGGVAGTWLAGLTGTTLTAGSYIAFNGPSWALSTAPAAIDGAITGVRIAVAGTDYYEENDHLDDRGPDAWTFAQCQIWQCRFATLDGIGINAPHFADADLDVRGNSFGLCAQGAILLGGNNCVIEANSFGANGFHPTAGFWPGIHLLRTVSSPQNVRIAANELDSNTYAHVLMDGCTTVQVTQNRLNSWVTAFNRSSRYWAGQTGWTQQIPGIQIAQEINTASSTNVDCLIENNSHRAQPPDAFVPVASCATTIGNPVIPANGAAFIIGARVQILNPANVPIAFSGGGKETKITAIDTVAGTITLQLSPSVTLPAATIKAVINDEHVTWVDLGRHPNSTRTRVIDPSQSQNSSLFTKVANYRADIGPGSQVRLVDGTAQKIGDPGLGAAVGRITAALQIPASSVPVVVPWASYTYSDPGQRLEGGPTGRYFLLTSGIFEAAGTISVKSAAAGETFIVQAVIDSDAVTTAGVISTQAPLVLQERTYAAVGAATEAISFSFAVPVSSFRTYVGANPPTIAPASTETGLIWWNPVTLENRRWSGSAWVALTQLPGTSCTTVAASATITAVAAGFAVGAMVRVMNGATPITFGGAIETTITAIDAKVGTITVADLADAAVASGRLELLSAFDPKTTVKIRILTKGAVARDLDVSSASLNWCSFRQIG